MKYHSLYRKWRPQVFEDIIGQEHITKTLINAITSNRISHAYVFSGPRGVGKTTTARILAKSLNCVKGPTVYPCNECDHCIKITEGYSMDVIEIDGASNRGIDDIRELRNKVKFLPTEGNYKVYIIDEVHMLTTEAFNALLKTLEEPPPHVVFVFATTAPHKIPDTILSRCQWFNFKRIPLQKIINKLKMISIDEKLVIEEKALNIIAKTATGSLRDAESHLEQIIVYCGKKVNKKNVVDILGIIDDDIFFDILDAISKNDSPQAIEIINKISDSGGDPVQFIRNLTEYIHNLSLAKICNPHILKAKGVFIDENKKILNQSKSMDIDVLFNMVDTLTETEKKMKYSFYPWLILEMFVLKFISRNKKKETEKVKLPLKPDTRKTNNMPKKTTLLKAEMNDTDEIKEKTEEKKESKISTQFDVIEIWPKILSKVKKTRISLYSFIAFNNSLTVENNKIIIGFNHEHIFHKEILEKKANKALLQDLIKEETGEHYIVECMINKNGSDHLMQGLGNENTDDLERDNRTKKVILKNKNEINEVVDNSNEDPMLQESLNLFLGKIIEE